MLSKTDGPSAPAFSASVVDITSALLVAGLLSNADRTAARDLQLGSLYQRETRWAGLAVSTCAACDTAVVL